MAHSISRRQFLQGSGAAALSVAAAGLLSSCGGSSASNAGSTGAAGSSSTYTVLYSRQPATLNYLVCSADPDLYHGTQCIDTLVEYDNRGKIREGLATAWEWDADSLTWTFHLRDENWVDCNGEVKEHITATDFLVGLEWVLNASKNEANNTSMPTLYIVGAEEYYEKTKDMGAAAADLCAVLDEPLTVQPMQRVLVPTGLAIELPGAHAVALVYARSGLSIKHGLCMANGVGVVDSDYRGELKVPMVNLGAEAYTIQPGERVAQLCIAPVYTAAFVQADALDETARGEGGFGSTGK